MSVFAALDIYCDDAEHSAAMNMAIDEALLGYSTAPSIRFYRWNAPALSFGYFGRFAEVAGHARERDLVRRWTGGGIVFHGEDLTYSIVIPSRDAVFSESSTSIYEKIHRALADTLAANGTSVELAAVVPHTRDERWELASAVTDRPYNHCFANAVRADVLLNGRKIAGAAQRRTRAGLLHQGSIQHPDPGNGLAERFVHALSANCTKRTMDEEIWNRGRELARQRYATQGWLRKR
jgi:lipoate-protein ligase A